MIFSKKPPAHIVFESDDAASKRFDVVLLIAILGSVIVAILDSLKHLHEAFGMEFYLLEWGFTILFTIEYMHRIWLGRRTRGYVLSFYGLVIHVLGGGYLDHCGLWGYFSCHHFKVANGILDYVTGLCDYCCAHGYRHLGDQCFQQRGENRPADLPYLSRHRSSTIVYTAVPVCD